MLNGKVVVITGGAGLLGKEFCSVIVKNGGIAVLADTNQELAFQTVLEIKEKYSSDNIVFNEMNITSKESINELIHFTDSKYGKIDALVNNAYPKNKNYGHKFEDVTYEDFCENLNLNLGGYFLSSQIFAKYFIDQGYGNIINISSIYGVVAPKFEIYDNTPMTMPVEYAAIKSGLIHLTKYMAKYFKGKKIRVNTLSPGGIFANQPKPFLDKYNSLCLSKGMLDKSDLNGSLLYLLSDLSKYLNGQNIVVDDGFTL